MTRLRLILLSVFATFMTFDLASGASSDFKVTCGYNMSGGTPLSVITSRSMSALFCSLQCVNECSSATYSLTYQTCITFKEKFHHLTWTQAQAWCMMYIVESISVSNWTLVFRAQSGINVSFYDLWENNGHYDDLSMSSDFPIGCYRLDNLGNCKRHFRSYVLDNWTNIDQIKLSVYVNGSETAYMIFNGSASDRQSWFNRKLLEKSYWTSLANDTQVFWFSFQGETFSGLSRRFIIFSYYWNCWSDSMYFMAIDSAYESCSPYWGPIPSYPMFFYSPVNQMVRPSAQPPEYRLADFLAVFINQKS